MFRKVEIRHYKCLKRITIDLNAFNVLIGPNASGKSTLLDIFGFLRDTLNNDVEMAVRRRATSLQETIWQQKMALQGFEIAVEADIPPEKRLNGFDRVRYEVEIGLSEEGSIVVRTENLWLIPPTPISPPRQNALFPAESPDTEPIVHQSQSKTPAGYRLIVRKSPGGNDYFRSETTGWNITFRLSPRRLALSGIPEDQTRFPIALWFKESLLRHIQILQLNSQIMRQPCPADAPRTFQPDGSNISIMVAQLKSNHPQQFEWWLGHLQTVLDDLETVRIAQREEDRSRYLVLTYRHGLEAPTWMLSDGTLRMIALTLLAYLPLPEPTFLIEEPENGVHPRAIEAVFQALNSVYSGQIFIATHSPLFMALAKPEDLLIFGKLPNGATDIVRGTEHPALQTWQTELPIDTLFAAGVLG